jgi:hypothetical protein
VAFRAPALASGIPSATSIRRSYSTFSGKSSSTFTYCGSAKNDASIATHTSTIVGSTTATVHIGSISNAKPTASTDRLARWKFAVN